TTVILFVLAIAAFDCAQPTSAWVFDRQEFHRDIAEHFAWLGPIFAAVYAALYARFAAQWGYLSGTYNQIKAAEASKANASAAALASWKAGFIEDAELLHLSAKPPFCSVIATWGQEQMVKDAYTHNTPGSDQKFNGVMSSALSACRRDDEGFTPF